MTLLDRLLGREPKIDRLRPLGVRDSKAVYGGALLNTYISDYPISSLLANPQQRTAAFLRAYKCGWFYKAGHKISADISSLEWTISDGDAESGDREAQLDRPDLDIPFERLSPEDQLQRLLERPNPNQTGKQLFAKTQIRRDFAGTAMWYLEGLYNFDGAPIGELPTAIYGISPSRMTPSRDRNGNLIGWVLDADSQNPVAFLADEILNMPTSSADDGDGDLFGVGVVEAVYAELPITDLMARHTTDLLTTGGRLAGMLWPKVRALSENEFLDAQRAWRNVTSDPNAARRMLIFPEPMEYSQGASTPAEIGLPELSGINRDNILTAFPISPHLLRVPMPSGLNASGETRREEEAAYWSDIETLRVAPLTEYIQTGLVSRYEQATGRTFNFTIAIPNLDDAPSLIEKVGAFKGLVSVGFDPKEAVAAVGLDHIKWAGLPDILDPAKQLEMQQAAAQAESVVQTQAGDTSRRDASSTTVDVSKAHKTDKGVALGTATLTAFLDNQRARVSQAIRDTLPTSKAARKDAPETWWDADAEDKALRDALRALYLEVGRSGLQSVAEALDRIIPNKAVGNILTDLLAYGGSRITAINEATRQAVATTLAEGTRRGYSINQLIDGVPGEDFPGVKRALLDNGAEAFDAYRAEVIARTETMLSYNRSALRGYGEFGVGRVQAIDGDGDAECASRDGHIFDLDEALSIEDHPNGTLDWAPVLDKSWTPDPYAESLAVAIKALGEAATRREGEVHVHVPEVKVPDVIADMTPVVSAIQGAARPEVDLSPIVKGLSDLLAKETVVNVPPAEIKVAPPEVNVNVDSVRVVELPDRVHTINRDRSGRPTGSTETDA